MFSPPYPHPHPHPDSTYRLGPPPAAARVEEPPPPLVPPELLRPVMIRLLSPSGGVKPPTIEPSQSEWGRMGESKDDDEDDGEGDPS